MKTGRVALGIFLGLMLTLAGVGLWWPERVLQVELARQRWLADASVQSLQVGDHRWSYLEAGHGPLLVLVHGFTGSKENWLPVMRVLAKNYHVIAPDLPGWGESERKPDVDYGPKAQATRLAAFLISFKEKPTLLVGHSMGGQIVGLLTAQHPELVERIALISSAGVRFKTNAFGRAVLAGHYPFAVRTRAELHRYLGIIFTHPPFVPWPLNEALTRRRRADVEFEQEVLDRIARGPEAFALESELIRIQMPVLVLWCHDDRVIDVSAVDVFHRGLSSSQTVLLSDCGHMPTMEQPHHVAEALEQFIALTYSSKQTRRNRQ